MLYECCGGVSAVCGSPRDQSSCEGCRAESWSLNAHNPSCNKNKELQEERRRCRGLNKVLLTDECYTVLPGWQQRRADNRRSWIRQLSREWLTHLVSWWSCDSLFPPLCWCIHCFPSPQDPHGHSQEMAENIVLSCHCKHQIMAFLKPWTSALSCLLQDPPLSQQSNSVIICFTHTDSAVIKTIQTHKTAQIRDECGPFWSHYWKQRGTVCVVSDLVFGGER